MPTRNVVLTERQETLIETLVQSGRYHSASEAIRDGLRLIENREAEEAAKLEGLRSAARVGADALERGKFKEFANASALVEHLKKLADTVLAGSEVN
jgi:antitoxin ParD1/3/4